MTTETQEPDMDRGQTDEEQATITPRWREAERWESSDDPILNRDGAIAGMQRENRSAGRKYQE